MKKKFIVGLVVLFSCVFALAACGGDDGGDVVDAGSSDVIVEEVAEEEEDVTTAAVGDAYGIYKAAMESLIAADGYEYDITIESAYGADGAEGSSTMSGHVIQNDPTGNVEMKMEITTEASGMTLDMTSYYKDGYQYTEMMGMKIKTAMDQEEMQSSMGKLPDFNDDAITDQSVTEAGGATTVSFVISGEAAQAYIDEALEGIEGAEDVEVDLGGASNGIKITATVDSSGNLTELIQEQTSTTGGIESTSLTKMSNIKIGKVAFDFPSDLDAYQEADLDNLSGLEVDTE
ncbi:MAG: hypothetical protein LBR44_01590 [Clostridiales Family XIII bacterium]|jgi:hypothetical protein|nr:hypothetical protein [Clostridiales Family XIII bacterium]